MNAKQLNEHRNVLISRRKAARDYASQGALEWTPQDDAIEGARIYLAMQYVLRAEMRP